MTKDQRIQYERMLHQKWNENGIRETAYKEGVKIGVEKGVKIGVEKGVKIGVEIGVEKGVKIGVEKIEARMNIEFINRLLNKDIMPISEIAELMGVDEAYVREIKNAKT